MNKDEIKQFLRNKKGDTWNGADVKMEILY